MLMMSLCNELHLSLYADLDLYIEDKNSWEIVGEEKGWYLESFFEE